MQTIFDNLDTEGTTFDFEDKDEDTCSKIIYSGVAKSESKGTMLSLRNIFSG